jgi:hypothetical protein
MSTRNQMNARAMGRRLRLINAELTNYRRWAETDGLPRLALSDLATYDALVSIFDGDEEQSELAMARLIEAREQPSLDDRHCVVFQAHQDEVSEALERLGLLPKEGNDDD